MTARTLEEIEAISCGITYMSGHETYVCDPGEPCRKCLKRRVRAAVAIAQEQRAEIARLNAEIIRRIDEKKDVCEALGVDWQTVVNLGLKVQQAIGTKR